MNTVEHITIKYMTKATYMLIHTCENPQSKPNFEVCKRFSSRFFCPKKAQTQAKCRMQIINSDAFKGAFKEPSKTEARYWFVLEPWHFVGQKCQDVVQMYFCQITTVFFQRNETSS